MRVLLVERDPKLGEELRADLRQAGYAVNWVNDGRSAEAALQTEEYDLLAIDAQHPKGVVPRLIEQVRRGGRRFPVLVFGEHDLGDQRVAALDSGADAFLAKPFSLDELTATLRALTRQRFGRSEPQLVVGALALDPAARTVAVRGKAVEVSAREFALLQVLAESGSRAVSKSRLEEALYPWNEEVESNAVEVHIHRLRKKLGGGVIRTVRGIGYALNIESPQERRGTMLTYGTTATPQPTHPRPAARSNAPLLSTLRGVVAEIEQALELQHTFTEEVAAELRRPLHAARSQAESALARHPDKVVQRRLQGVLRGIEQALRLLDLHVALARLDQPSRIQLERQTDLCQVCAEVMAPLAPHFTERAVIVRLKTPCRGPVWGRQDMLTLMLRHLLETLTQAAQPRDHIDVAVTEDESNGIRLTLLHRGPTASAPPTLAQGTQLVSSEQALQSAATKRRQQLALALAERVTTLHGASLVTSHHDGRLQISISFPAAEVRRNFNWLI